MGAYIFRVLAFLTMLATAVVAGPDDDEPPFANGLEHWLLKQVDRAAEKRAAEVAALKTPEQIAKRQQRLRQRFLDAIGGLPERTPLNPKITGTIQRDGYRVEKVLFESQPGFYVTAALFLPDPEKFPPPWPGIVVPCGHSRNGKANEGYQRGCALAALNGMAALIFDPIEQGERGSGGTRGHNAIGQPAITLGWNTARIEIWDGMRAIDYLQSRADIVDDKIGCMGNSGGGTQTAYLMALDERIKAASPSCYISTLPHVTRAIGPQDAEQNIFGQLAFGMDHPDYLTMRAPMPVLICAAKQDFFPIEGTRQAYAEARTIFDKLGHDDRLALVEHDAKHGWAQPLREAAVAWMNRWLRGVDEPTPEPADLKVLTDEEIQVTEQGDVTKLPGARSPFDFMRDEAERQRARRRVVATSGTGLARLVREIAGIQPLAEIGPLKLQRGETKSSNGGAVTSVVFERDGMPLPGVLFQPEQQQGDPVLLIHGEGSEAAREKAEAMMQKGRLVLAVDVRGFGKTARTKKNFYGERDGGDAYLAYLLGESLVGQRAEDIIALGDWLRQQHGGAVEIVAIGWACTPAQHAAVVEPKLFETVELQDRPPTWRQAIKTAEPHHFSDLVHGVLSRYDQLTLHRALGDRQRD